MIQLIQSIFNVLVVLGLLFLTLIILYLWYFAVVYFFKLSHSNRYKVRPESISEPTRFAFVVPAHNEEESIAATVKNLLSVDYSRGYFDVFVIADNCTDSTPEKAVHAGARCLERKNPALHGKGYALRFAFTELISDGYNAFVVIDADSIVSNNFLSCMDHRLKQGALVVQAYYGLSNPNSSILTYLFQVGSLIENKLFWEAKQAFGLPIMLRGNGMCFSKKIIEKYPWDAFSIVEDTEYGLKLVENDVRIHFASETGVYAHQPETLDQAFAQRVRWASGNSAITKSRAFSMLLKGFNQKNINLADLGFSLLAGSKPLLLLLNAFLLFLLLILQFPCLLLWAGFLLIAQLSYICVGIVLNGINSLNMYRLLLSPFYLAWLCVVSMLGFVGYRKNKWVRTNRK